MQHFSLAQNSYIMVRDAGAVSVAMVYLVSPVAVVPRFSTLHLLVPCSFVVSIVSLVLI